MFKDYYRVLDVQPDATADEIRRQYRVLAKFYHPDVNHGDRAEYATRKMQEVNEAFEVLNDEQRRAAYDAQCGVRTGGSSYSRGFSSDEGELAEIYSMADAMAGLAPGSPDQADLRERIVSQILAFQSRWPGSQYLLLSQALLVDVLLDTCEDGGRVREAARKLGQMDESPEHRNNAAFAIAYSYYLEKRYDRALGLLDGLDGRFAITSVWHGDCLSLAIRIHLDMGDVVKARIAYNRLLSDAPGYEKLPQVERWMALAGANTKGVAIAANLEALPEKDKDSLGAALYWGIVVCGFFGQVLVPVPVLGFILGGVVGYFVLPNLFAQLFGQSKTTK